MITSTLIRLGKLAIGPAKSPPKKPEEIKISDRAKIVNPDNFRPEASSDFMSRHMGDGIRCRTIIRG